MFSYGQNSFPANGNVGIGTYTPSEALDVNGNLIVDSCLIVKDSVRFKDRLVVDQEAKFKTDLTVIGELKAKDDLKVIGVTKMKGDAFVEGDFKFKNLSDPSALEDRFLMINSNGKARDLSITEITDIIYNPPTPCKLDVNGNVIPIWKSTPGQPGILYTGQNCEVNVGIGISNPDVPLHVIGNAKITGELKVGANSIFLGGVSQAGGNTLYATGDLEIQSDAANSFNTIINANNNGNVGIGMSNPGHKLEVAGTIRACKLIAETNSWCDYVFDSNYSLMPLSEVEEFIQINKHLPNIPSETEVLESGVDVVDMETKLLRKVEELTLYMIDLEKKNQELQKKVEELSKKID